MVPFSSFSCKEKDSVTPLPPLRSQIYLTDITGRGFSAFAFLILHLGIFNSHENLHLEKLLVCLVLKEKCLYETVPYEVGFLKRLE